MGDFVVESISVSQIINIELFTEAKFSSEVKQVFLHFAM